MLNLSAEIMRLVGRCEGISGAKPQPKLRKLNRIRTVQGSLAIEGNSLSLEQITALLDGKRVLGPKKEILEVQNAIAAYQRVSTFRPTSIGSLLQAHATLMRGMIPDAGKWRSGAIGIMKGSRVSHVAPKAQLVQGLVKDLLEFVKKSDLSPLVTSSAFHHEFEFIHPFSDGNGRMGRLWQHVILVHFNPIFEYVPVESIVLARQAKYYAALERADREGDSAEFIEFMLDSILSGISEFAEELRPEPVTASDRLEAARVHFGMSWFSRKDYQGLVKQVSSPTASRDLKAGVDQGVLAREGEKALTRYRFRR